MVGVVPDIEGVPAAWFTTPGDRVLLLGKTGGVRGPAYLRLLHGIEQGVPPEVDLAAEARLARAVACWRSRSWCTRPTTFRRRARPDPRRGHLGRGLGAELELPLEPLQLFSETQARAVVAVPAERVDEALAMAREAKVPARDVGAVGGDRLSLGFDGGRLVATVEELHRAWSTALPRALGM